MVTVPVCSPELQEDAIHEAGHAVISWHFGGAVVTTIWIGGELGSTGMKYVRDRTTADTWYRIVTFLAGGTAVRTIMKIKPHDLQGDLAYVEKSLARLLADQEKGIDIRPPWAVSEVLPPKLDGRHIITLATWRARVIIEEHAHEVHRVAAFLEDRLNLDYADLVRLLGERRVP